MGKKKPDTKLHKDFANKSKAKEHKRDKQATKNDLKRLDSSDADMDDDDYHHDDLANE